ncbi:MAG: sigma-70 family RNA polymerase sigma factor [Thermoanaerobaculia bacterium]
MQPEPDLDLRQEERCLVERMLGGDEGAMEEFAAGYLPGLYRFALARLGGNRELAQEIVQATSVKALDRLFSYRGEAPLAGWLAACCLNEIRMHFRRYRSQPRWIELDADGPPGRPEPVATEPGADCALATREEAERVHRALDQLPPRYARALEWKYWERLSVEEIAGRLGLGAKAAESLLSRARAAFRQGYRHLSEGARVVALKAEGGLGRG